MFCVKVVCGKARRNFHIDELERWEKCPRKTQLNERSRTRKAANRHRRKRENSSGKRFTMCEKECMARGRFSRRLRLDYPKRAGPGSSFWSPKKGLALFAAKPGGICRRRGRVERFQRIAPARRWRRCGGKATALSLTTGWQPRRVRVHAGAAPRPVIVHR